MTGRGATATGLGVAAVLAGVLALVLDQGWLGLVAGAAGGAGAAAGVRLGGRADALAAQLERADARVTDLEAELAEARAALPVAAPAADDIDLADVDEEVLVDPVTGLFAEPYFEVSLASRVAAARRHLRPVAVVLLDVAEGVREGSGPTPVDPELVAARVRETLREADTACRLDDGRFALLLEDTPENGAVWTVERVRRSLAATHRHLTLWAGVACYPAHAFDAGELLARATAALEAARQWRQDRIEVATASE
jgi:two-component system cell cycle response regulator